MEPSDGTGPSGGPGVETTPGWYLDPAGSGCQRWWDGRAWGGVFSWSVYLPAQPPAWPASAWEFITRPLRGTDGPAGGLLSLGAMACSLLVCGAAGFFLGVSLATGGPVGGVAPVLLTAFSVLFPFWSLAVSLLRGRNRSLPQPLRGSSGVRPLRRIGALAARLRLFRSLPPLAGRACTAAYYLALTGFVAATVASLFTSARSGGPGGPWATTWGQRAAALFLECTCIMIAGTAGERLRGRRAAWRYR